MAVGSVSWKVDDADDYLVNREVLLDRSNLFKGEKLSSTFLEPTLLGSEDRKLANTDPIKTTACAFFIYREYSS
jgi:hypothetical protein